VANLAFSGEPPAVPPMPPEYEPLKALFMSCITVKVFQYIPMRPRNPLTVFFQLDDRPDAAQVRDRLSTLADDQRH
jgi:hypothetical protein